MSLNHPKGAWIVGIVLFLFVLLFWAITTLWKRKRRTGIEVNLSQVGFSRLQERKDLSSALQGLPLFQSAASRHFFELSMAMVRRADQDELILFEGNWRVRGGVGTTSFSGLALHAAGLNIPYFRWIFPDQHLQLSKFFQPYLKKDPSLSELQFPGTRHSDHFGHSADPVTVLQLFRAAKLLEFAGQFHGVLEGYGQWVFAYGPIKLMQPEDSRVWLAHSSAFVGLVKS